MSDDTSAKFDLLSLSEAELVDQACDRFETAWRAGDWPCIEGYLDAVPEACRLILLHELLKLELELRAEVGEQPSPEEYRRRFPGQRAGIDQIFGESHARSEPRSTLPDEVLGFGVPDANAPTVDMRTLDLDPGQLPELADGAGALGRLVGEYVVLDRLGSGGMGVVYRALQRSAGRFVALKLIRADWCGESTEITNREAEIRFRHEAQALAQLEHDHIVPLYEAGHAAGLLFFSMRLIKGRSLGQMVLSEGPLPPRRAAYYIEAMARAIQYAHEHKILHRDIKPGNILVDESDRPYLIDLGLAKSLDATDYTTLTGKALGTAEYMSPEQAKGQDEISFTTDVYGLGATFFTLLTGRPPFSGPRAVVVLRKVIDEEPAWPREADKRVGKELKAICLKCLEKDPTKRFSSAGELAVVLKNYLNYEPTGVTPPRPWERLGKWVRRQPWRAAAAGLAFLVFSVAAGAWAWNTERSRETAEVFVRDLRTTSIAELPAKIQHFAAYRGWIKPRLHKLLQTGSGDPELRTRILLALLPSEPARARELADCLLECGREEHRVICGALVGHWPAVEARIRTALVDLKADNARRTRAAAALIALDGPKTPAGRAWSELRLIPDPTMRVDLLEWLVYSELKIEVLADRLESEPDVSVRRQLIQALGALGQEKPPAGASTALTGRMLAQYRDDPDPGIHSSLAYLLHRWGMDSEIKRTDAQLAGKPRSRHNWYVNSLGMTMAVIDVPESHRLLPPAPGERPERFSIATTETPLILFQEFDPTHAARRKQEYEIEPAAIPDAAADVINYFDAGRFCNWLSEREGIPPDQWCYRHGEAEGIMVLVPDYQNKKGYRLPSTSEWEFAARAGTTTDRYYGQDATHVDAYAWHSRNAGPGAGSIGRLRPNDFGLFDVLGNVMEWCYNPNPSSDPACRCRAGQENGSCEMRLETLKGGSIGFAAVDQMVKNRHLFFDNMPPNLRFIHAGIRVVRNEP
jgi:serine/threonine-protein kinase